MTTTSFMIVGQHDHPIYEVDLAGPKDVGVRGAAGLMPLVLVSTDSASVLPGDSNKRSIYINLCSMPP
jgi:hypothetical protein